MRMTMRLTVGLAVFLAALAGSTVKAEDLKTAIFAGGCFWCVEADFDKVPGVTETVSGYTGGTVPDPTYRQVTGGDTGHFEAVRITYDADVVTYAELLEVFWHSVDPTDAGGQFCDRGSSYRTGIFVLNERQQELALETKQEAAEALGQPIATIIEPAGPFYPAEDYHQDYYEKNPVRYNYYRWSCGRNDRVKELWGDQAYAGIPKEE